VEETERVYQGGAVLFRYRGEGPATLRYLYTGLSGEVFYTLEEGRLTAWARFRLEGEALEAQRLTLLAGEAPLLSPAGKALPQAAFRTLEGASRGPRRKPPLGSSATSFRAGSCFPEPPRSPS